jgi:hypothetical protein
MCLPVVIGNATAAPVILNTGVPASAPAGQPFNLSVTIRSSTSYLDTTITYRNPDTGDGGTLDMVLASGSYSDGVWSCEVPAPSWQGTIEYQIKASDGIAPTYFPGVVEFGQIEIIGEEKPSEIPWHLVIMFVFLGVVLVLTELAFKPGVYRRTGRERARALEEEDREREQEGEEPPVH